MFITGNSGFPKSLDISKAIDKAAGAEREVVGRKTYAGPAGNDDNFGVGGNSENPGKRNITAPATSAAAEWDGWGTALKPAWEPVIVARKPIEGTVAANVLKWGAGGINIDGCRVGTEGGTAKGNPPKGESNGIYGDGINGACDIVPLNAGRWPSNLVHDGSDEVVALFPVTGPARARRLNGNELKPPRAAYGDYRKRTEGGVDDNGGSASRFFQACPWSDDDRRLYYVPKASKRDRDEGLEEFEERPRFSGGMEGGCSIPLKGSPTPLSRNTHPTVKPTALMRYLVRLVTPPGGTVLDPFMGSGSTGKAARLEGFGFVGIELERESYNIAEARIAWADRQAEEAEPVQLLMEVEA